MFTVDELLALTAPDEPRGMKAEARDRALLGAAADQRAFTTKDVVRRASCTSWYSAAAHLFRVLHRDGHLRIVSPDGTKPYVYEWVSGPDDLEALRAGGAPVEKLVAALEAEVDRLRARVGEPPLSPTAVAS